MPAVARPAQRSSARFRRNSHPENAAQEAVLPPGGRRRVCAATVNATRHRSRQAGAAEAVPRRRRRRRRSACKPGRQVKWHVYAKFGSGIPGSAGTTGKACRRAKAPEGRTGGGQNASSSARMRDEKRRAGSAQMLPRHAMASVCVCVHTR